jgi:hypothetical protein
MRSALALLFAAAVAASDVVELGKDSFKDFISDNPLVLAECKLCIHNFSATHHLTHLAHSLRSMVWSLQGFGSRV